PRIFRARRDQLRPPRSRVEPCRIIPAKTAPAQSKKPRALLGKLSDQGRGTLWKPLVVFHSQFPSQLGPLRRNRPMHLQTCRFEDRSSCCGTRSPTSALPQVEAPVSPE